MLTSYNIKKILIYMELLSIHFLNSCLVECLIFVFFICREPSYLLYHGSVKLLTEFFIVLVYFYFFIVANDLSDLMLNVAEEPLDLLVFVNFIYFQRKFFSYVSVAVQKWYFNENRSFTNEINQFYLGTVLLYFDSTVQMLTILV